MRDSRWVCLKKPQAPNTNQRLRVGIDVEVANYFIGAHEKLIIRHQDQAAGASGSDRTISKCLTCPQEQNDLNLGTKFWTMFLKMKRLKGMFVWTSMRQLLIQPHLSLINTYTSISCCVSPESVRTRVTDEHGLVYKQSG